MIVDLQKEFIFVKTVKTGGSQIEISLAPFLSKSAIQTLDTIGGLHSDVRDKFRRTTRLPISEFVATSIELLRETPHKKSAMKGVVKSLIAPRGPSIRGLSVEQNHMNARDIRKIVGHKKFEECTKVTVVRCPFNRVASQFWRSNLRKNDGARSSREHLRDDFLLWIRENPELISVNQHILTDAVESNSRASLADLHLRYEDLGASLCRLATILGADCDALSNRFASFPARNPSRPRDFSITDLFSEDAKAIVVELAAWEFQTFGYDPNLLKDDSIGG